MERWASNAFLRLERAFVDDRTNTSDELGFDIEVIELPWAIDSREIVYWGAVTFPGTQKQSLSIGIVTAILMSVVLILCVISVTCWLWHRRITRKDEIESMVGSADLDKGPIHFQDFEDLDELNKTRSFRNIEMSSVSCDGSQGKGEMRGPVISSMSRFINRGGSNIGVGSVRMQSFGGEAFAGMSRLDDEYEPKSHGRSRPVAETYGEFCTRTSLDSLNIAEGEDGMCDNIVVRSIGGELFAMLDHIASMQDLSHFRKPGESPRKEDDVNRSSSISNRSDANELQMGFMMDEENGEQMVTENDLVAMSPKVNQA